MHMSIGNKEIHVSIENNVYALLHLVILMHLMCTPQKWHTFCDIFTFNAFVSGGTRFFSGEGFLNELYYVCSACA